MTHKNIYEIELNRKAAIEIGPRVEADIRRRIKELEGRWPGARTSTDWHELQRLRQLLRLVETRGGSDAC